MNNLQEFCNTCVTHIQIVYLELYGHVFMVMHFWVVVMVKKDSFLREEWRGEGVFGGVGERDNRNRQRGRLEGWADQKEENEKRKIDAEGGFSEYESLRASFPVPLMYSNAKSVMLGLDWSPGETRLW